MITDCGKRLSKHCSRIDMRGFTLIELMVTVAIIGILAAVALPAYNEYIRRAQAQEAFAFLSDYRTKFEQYYQDNRNYGSASNCAADPSASKWNNFATPPAKNFEFNCKTNTAPGDVKQQSYTLTATGIGGMVVGVGRKHEYTINENGVRTTTVFKGVDLAPPAQCWLSKSSVCSDN